MVAQDCLDDLVSKVRLVTSLSKKTLYVNSIDDLIANAGQIQKPAVGIMYEGARPAQVNGGNQVVVSAEAVYSVLLVLEQPILHLKKDHSPIAHGLLDEIRVAIHGTRGPSGHFWKWVVEAPVVLKGPQGVWLQRWSCPFQLPPQRS